MKTEKTIYDLELHESIEIEFCKNVTLVPGGWIYSEYSGGVSQVFVPYNDEFKKTLK